MPNLLFLQENLTAYSTSKPINCGIRVEWPLVIGASISAFAGAYVGAKMLKKVTLRSVQLMVSALLIVVGCGLIAGVL